MFLQLSFSTATAAMVVTTRPQEILAGHAATSAAGGLRDHGVVRVNGVLTPSTCKTLLSHVNEELEKTLLEQQNMLCMESDDALSSRFAKVLARQSECGTTRRHDLKLDLKPPVSAAIEEMLSSLGPAFSECLGEDAVLYELASLISEPGSPLQPFHPDTPFLDDQGACVLTAFIALQPVEEDMGPTTFLPASHTAKDHEAFKTKDDGGEAYLSLLRSRPVYRGLLGAGDATVFDSRLLHRGGANESKRRRVLFYASFRARDAKAPPGTILYDLRGRYSLAGWRHSWRST